MEAKNNNSQSVEESKSEADNIQPRNVPNEVEQEVKTADLTKKFFDEVIANSKTIPHDPKFPFIPWYGEHLQKWRKDNSNATFEEWIAENNTRVQKNRKWKECFGITSAILGIGIGVGVVFGAPAWLAAFGAIAALVNGGISIWKGAQLNRDIEGRGYLLKSMEDTMHHIIADLHTKIDAFQNVEEKT